MSIKLDPTKPGPIGQICLDCKQPAWCIHKRRRYIQKNRDHINARMRSHRLFTLYGLTPIAHSQMLNEQNSQCAICRKSKKLQVDHDHRSGRTRELLCASCNHNMTLVDNIPRLNLFEQYRMKHSGGNTCQLIQ